jgi:hypothetical protein
MYYVKIILLAACMEIFSCLGINLEESSSPPTIETNAPLLENQQAEIPDLTKKNIYYLPIHITIG